MCLAFQNAMAAAIGGYTIHHWTGIPPCATAQGSGFGDSHKMSTKCQCLRVILVDELSMVSAELFGALEYVVRKVIRQRGTYKVRPDKSQRRFGGVNVVAFADFWQLPPVGGTSLSSCPTQASPGLSMDGMCLLWDSGEDSVRKCWSLEQPMRCVDPWYNEFLRQCRFGELTEDFVLPKQSTACQKRSGLCGQSLKHSANAGLGGAAGAAILETLCKSGPRRGHGGGDP